MMNRWEPLAVLLCAAWLAGCAGPGTRLAPVESRAIEGAAPPAQTTVPPSASELPGGADVTVTTLPAPEPFAGAPRPLAAEPSGGAVGRPPASSVPSPDRQQLALATPVTRTPAVDEILRDVRRRWAAGQHELAAAGLERALRIEPANPYLWQHLAAVRLDQGKPGQAEQFAAKSNSVAGDNPPLRLRNWRIIAEARRMNGDERGRREAEARGARYESTR